MSSGPTTLASALQRQADACAALGSKQYADLVAALRVDAEQGGLTDELLAHRPEDPLRDALVLRLLGAVHRIVLSGRSPALAARYRSAGGDGAPIPVSDFLETVSANRAEVEDALGQTVQTNEVGRCAALLPAFAEISRRTQLPLNMLEVGASAGLLSNWDRYSYDCFGSTYGPPKSAVRLTDRWDDPFDLHCPTSVIARASCDIAPLDVLDEPTRLRLLSFVWPDQSARFELLSRALEVARTHPPHVDSGDAAEWLAPRLAGRPTKCATIVFHSIVWQYLPRATKDAMRATLASEGSQANADRPSAWIRMEPAGPVADVRITYWPGGIEHRIAETTYHGMNVRIPQPSDERS